MSSCEPSIPSAQQTPALADAGVPLREGLSLRSQAASPDQARRLLKTLARLRPAADVALAGVATGRAGLPGQSFESVLAKLSNA